MTFSIHWHPKAAKYVEKLPKEIAERILAKFDQLSEEPFRFLEHYEGDYYKFRVGEYRALIDVDVKNSVLKVQVFDKRERIY